MKKTRTLLLALILLTVECSAPATITHVDAATIEAPSINTPTVETKTINTTTNAEVSTSTISSQENISTSNLSTAEIEGLLFMREEEKLARDVYLSLYDQWKIPIFQNIAKSESTHMDAILRLLDQYGLEDPAANKDIGEFTNPDLQALYTQLVVQGNQSLSDALKIGAAIEEIDILDLEKYIAQTDKEDIVVVYENLTKGSRNHLRSFTKLLQQQTGEIYTPQYLSPDAYEAIINSSMESGGRGNGNRNGKGNGRGK